MFNVVIRHLQEHIVMVQMYKKKTSAIKNCTNSREMTIIGVIMIHKVRYNLGAVQGG